MKLTSSTDHRLPPWYMAIYATSSLMWFASMACVVLVMVDTLPFADDKDKDGGLQNCGGRYTYSSYKCYYSTSNAQVHTLARMNTAVTGFIV